MSLDRYCHGNQDPHKSLQSIRSSNSRSRLPRAQRSTTESTEIHGKENPNQLPLSVSFRVFSGYPFVMNFLAAVIRDTANPASAMKRPWAGRPYGRELAQPADHSCTIGVANPGSPSATARQRSWAQQPRTASNARSANSKGAK